MAEEHWIKRTWRWVLKHWKLIAGALVVGAATVIVVKGVRAVVGYVKHFRAWKSVPDDPGAIAINDGGEWIQIELPKDVTVDQVTAAGISDGEWTVEVKHETTDRHGDPARGRDSDLGL